MLPSSALQLIATKSYARKTNFLLLCILKYATAALAAVPLIRPKSSFGPNTNVLRPNRCNALGVDIINVLLSC